MYLHVVSEEDSTEEGIPSPLAPSLLVAFYDTQRIRWCYSLLYAQHPRHCGKDGVKPLLVFVVSFVLSATPQTGGNGQGI